MSLTGLGCVFVRRERFLQSCEGSAFEYIFHFTFMVKTSPSFLLLSLDYNQVFNRFQKKNQFK